MKVANLQPVTRILMSNKVNLFDRGYQQSRNNSFRRVGGKADVTFFYPSKSLFRRCLSLTGGARKIYTHRTLAFSRRNVPKKNKATCSRLDDSPPQRILNI